jgi:hypothetical protein
MQKIEQEPEQPKRRGNPAWLPGVSQNPAGKESKAARQARRDAIIASWAEPYGGMGTLRPAELELLRQGAELAMRKPRRSEDAVRNANSLSRILAQVGFVDKRNPPREPAEPAPAAPAEAAGESAIERLHALIEESQNEREQVRAAAGILKAADDGQS